MVNIPNQAQNDLDEMVQFIEKCNQRFKNKLYVSINSFVPKPNTEFSAHTFNKKEIEKQFNYIKSKLKIKFKTSPLRIAGIEYKLAHAKNLDLTKRI